MKHSVLAGLILGLVFSAQSARADWTPAKRLTWSSDDSELPAIAVDSQSTIHVVWNDGPLPYKEIYYRKSTDGGMTWSALKRLTFTPYNSIAPAIAIDSNDTILVAWFDLSPGNSEIYYKRSTDSGETWSAAQRLTWTQYESSYASLAIGSDNSVHVVWQDKTPGSYQIFYKNRPHRGGIWGAVKGITYNSGGARYPVIASDSSNGIHVVWFDYTPGNSEIFYRKSADGGTTWSPAKRLTYTSGGSAEPAMAIDSNDTIHVVWEDYTHLPEIYYKKSTDGGETWSLAKRITWTFDSYYAAIAVDYSNNLHLVWTDGNGSENYEIYYEKSTDEGATWISARRLSWKSGRSYRPVLGLDANKTVHVVWQDNSPGNYEIYYRSGK